MVASADPTIGRTVDTVESINFCILLLLVLLLLSLLVPNFADDDVVVVADAGCVDDNDVVVVSVSLRFLPLLFLGIVKNRIR